jgi:3-oxoacyl-[acyl-carrier-protein] synthase-1
MQPTTRRGDTLIGGIGARTATGLDAQQVALTWRAGKSWPRESPLVDRSGEPIATCRLASIPDDVLGRDRLVELAAPALVEALGPWSRAQRAKTHSVPPVAMILARPRPERPKDSLLSELAVRAGVSLDLTRSEEVALGRAGGVAAIALAMGRLAAGEDEAIVVGGVDSLYDPVALEELDGARRLHGSACENGFIPGEGAAFLLLTRRATVPCLGRIVAAATENEPRPFGSSEPTHGLGMTLAVKRALEAGSERRVEWVLSDVVYERHRVEEWLFVAGRMSDFITGGARHDQPLLKTGELAAAAGPVLVVIACALWRAAGAPAGTALVALHSDGAERGALVVRGPA